MKFKDSKIDDKWLTLLTLANLLGYEVKWFEATSQSYPGSRIEYQLVKPLYVIIRILIYNNDGVEKLNAYVNYYGPYKNIFEDEGIEETIDNLISIVK